MAYPADDTAPPRTLKPDPAPVTTPKPAPAEPETDITPLSYLRQSEDEWNNYRGESARNGTLFRVNKDGYVEEYVDPVASGGSLNPFFNDGESEGGWTLNTSGARAAQVVYDNYIDAQLEFDRFTEDSKAAKAALGTARSYADIEAPKSKEVARQFQDFENRATLLYDLMADEQQYGMRADDQNMQNRAFEREYGETMPFFAKPTMGSALSNILAPSLPEYVRPDYRLNQSVGLPGPQGFDDSDYDEYGMPRFAFGTSIGIKIQSMPIRTWPWGGA